MFKKKTLRAVTGHNKSSILGCILITVIFLSFLSTSPEVIAHTQSPGLVKLLLQKTLSQNLIETLGKLILFKCKRFPLVITPKQTFPKNHLTFTQLLFG